MKRIIFAAAALASLAGCSPKIAVDTLVTNGQVYTVDNQFTNAQAFAIKDGNFVEVGTSSALQKKYKAASKIDAGGKAIFPGFYDPHSHFLGLGQMLSQADLVGSSSFEEIIERLKKFDAAHPENPWLIGRGWDQNDWAVKEFPSKTLLDAAFPNKPVFLTRIDGHAAVVNSRAMQLAKLTASSRVDGGDVELKNGEPTGILIDNAMNLVGRVIPRADEAQKRAMLKAAENECFSLGLTTVSDAGMNRNDIELIEKMQAEGNLKIRDYVMISLGFANLEYYLNKGIIKTPRLHVRSVKIYADGALGSRGACLLKPYSDAPDKTGFLLLSPQELDLSLQAIYNSDYQANTHCIGDSANRLVLDLYGKYLKGKNNRRWRIEHAQIVSAPDMPKFGKYSIIPSVQTTHCTSDMFWADERLGPDRIKTAYPFQELLKQNGVLANGSDFPVEMVNPLYGFHAAVARQDADNQPAGGFQMENALSREQALRAMTIWSAYANFEENERGSIEKGKMADFVILEEDIMKIPHEKLRSVKVKQTWVGGERVYGL